MCQTCDWEALETKIEQLLHSEDYKIDWGKHTLLDIRARLQARHCASAQQRRTVAAIASAGQWHRLKGDT